MTLGSASVKRIDRYRLLRVLGRGGMGTVYLAEDTLLGREVALKVVHEHLLGESNEDLVARFSREARNLAGLNHPGIIQIFDYSGLYSSRLYLVMEYVPGRNLEQVLRAVGPFNASAIGRLGVAVCGILAYAHRRSVIHQDLKPENILLTPDGHVKLTDFGISRRLVQGQVNAAALEIAGTPAFMAPERAQGQPSDARGDIFSLGATLYNLASGHRLADANSPLEVCRLVACGEFPSIREVAPGLTDALADAIDRALELDPGERFGDALELGEAFAEAVGLAAPTEEDVPRVSSLARLVEQFEVMGPAASTAGTAALVSPQGLSGPADAAPGFAATEVNASDGSIRSMAPTSVERPALPRLLGRFQLTHKLGSGAVGEVWAATDLDAAQRPIAVKLFRPVPGASIDEFKAEFRQLSSLRHPNVVTIHDFGTFSSQPGSSEGGLAFYTMELVEGTTLREECRGAAPEVIHGLLVQVARALNFLHSRTGRPHLSLKPGNILVTSDAEGQPRVVLTDPGNPTEKLRSIHQSERSSLPYAAPECLSSFSATPAADLYALGLIAYELLTGERPFAKAKTAATLRAAHLYEAVPDILSVAPDTPAPIAGVINALLRKSPAKRPSSAEAWIRAVNQVAVPPYPIETQATHRGRLESGPLVGRDKELRKLLDRYHDATTPGSTAPRVLLILGGSGVGKGRLLDAFRRAAQLEGAIVAEPGPVGGEETFGALLPWIRRRRRNLGEHHPVVRRHRQALAALLDGVEGEDAPIDPAAVAELFCATVRSPTLLLIRDVHRLDHASFEVLVTLSRTLHPLGPLGDEALPPLVLAMTAEEELLPADRAEVLRDLDGVVRVAMRGLDEGSVEEMLRTIFGVQPLPAPKVRDLLRLTGGKPGDIQDVLHTLLEHGDLEYVDGAWRLRPGVDVPLPRSTEETLKRRLEALTPAERDVLEALSVHGRPVPVRFVDSLGQEAAEAVQTLNRRAVLQRRLVDDRVCLTFVNEGLREALLRDMPVGVRESRHRAAAAWLEAHYTVPEVVEALAYHWTQGGRADRALSFLAEAADRSRSAGDMERARERYSEAVEMLPRLELGVLKRLGTESRLRLARGDVARLVGDNEASERDFARLVEIARDLEDDDLLGTALDRLALVLIHASRFGEAREHAERRLRLAQRAGDLRGQALALRLMGTITQQVKGPGGGIAELHKALEVTGEDRALDDVRARIAIGLSYSYTEAGQPDKGLQWADWGLTIGRQLALVEFEVSCLINASVAHFMLGQPDQTLRTAREAMTLSGDAGLRRNYVLALGNVGDALRVLGCFDEAEERLREALRETYKLGASGPVADRLVELATNALDHGAVHSAIPYLREAWRVHRSVPVPRTRLSILLVELRARLWSTPTLETAGTSRPTAPLLADAQQLAESIGGGTAQLQALALSGTAAASAGQLDLAATCADALISKLEALVASGPIGSPEVGVATVDLLQTLGRPDEAGALRRRLADAVDQNAARITTPELRLSFMNAPLHRRLREP